MKRRKTNRISQLLFLISVSAMLNGCAFSANSKTEETTQEIEPYIVDETIQAPTWEDSYTVGEKEEGDFRIIQISDPHYYSMRLTDECTLYKNAMARAAGRDALHIGEILDAFFEQMQEYNPDLLIVSGDLSMNGEKASHEDFAAYLSKFEEKGISVLVIPGNHDINSQGAWEIRDNVARPTEVVTPEEFAEIYADFGYKEALKRDESTLSYVADIGNNYWALMLDASIYKDGVVKPGGRLEQDTREWIQEVLDAAKEQGVKVISTTHQNLLVHNENFISDYTILDGASIVESYIKEGVAINLSGHLHCMNIVDRRENFYEVAMESLSVWPNLYGQLDIRKNGEISFVTHQTKHEANSYAYMLDSTTRTLGSRVSEDNVTEEEAEAMRDYVVQMNVAYFAGKILSSDEYKEHDGYKLWKDKAPESRNLEFIESIIASKRTDHTYIEAFIPQAQEE